MDVFNRRAMPPNQKILEILQSAWDGERENAMHIERLIRLAKNPSDKEILRLLYMDEHKHAKYFSDIYTKLCGQLIPDNGHLSQRPIGWDLCLELEKMMYKFTENVEFYRRVHSGFTDSEIREMLFEIITDETTMAIKMTHLFNKNRKFF